MNFMVCLVCLYKLHMINTKVFDVFKNFANLSDVQTTALRDIKTIMVKAYGINELPRPGKYQTKIRPTYHSDTELYDREKHD